MDFVTCGADPCQVYEGTLPKTKKNSSLDLSCRDGDEVSVVSNVKDVTSKNALDLIQQTLDEEPRDALIAPETPPSRSRAALAACSPSPNMLNPLPKTRWSPRSERLPIMPTCSASNGLDILTKRMAEGYEIRIAKRPASCWFEGPAVLSLSEDRLNLFLNPINAASETKEEGAIQIHASAIRRIDQGRSNASSSFSITVEVESGDCENYHLEAANAIDREVMVTTMLLILDQDFKGTRDRPIPCSPSLDPDPNVFSQPSLTVSESLDEIKEGPSKETSTRNHGDVTDFLSCTPSASSLKPVNSAQLPNTWCTTDACSFALNDITDTCTGIFALKQSPCLAPQQILVEEFITTALGAPHVFYNCISEGGYWEKEECDHEKKSTRHRASRLNAQAARLRTLRNEMSFAAALKQSKSTMQTYRSVKSFDSAAVGRQRQAADKAVKKVHNSPLLGSLVSKMALYDEKGDSKESDGCLYYDSDPEDYRTQTRKPRTVHAPSESFEERSMLNGIDFNNVGFAPRLSRKLDDDTIREISQTMINERMELVWHPTQTATCPNLSPLGVKVWIESGVHLNDGNFLLPKLTWAKASSMSVLQRLDLLDICRICPMDQVDRKVHPFVLTKRSFFVETQSDILVFQANSTEARDRIVFSLKLVVARLASLLMLRDIRAAEEFFSTSTVPGEAPEWTG